MSSFNHAFEIAFEVISDDEDGDDITPEMFSAALRKRADALDANPSEWKEACGSPFDTHKL